MKIKVKFGDGDSVVYEVTSRPSIQLSFLQKCRFSSRLLCELKRKIQKTHNILPVDQQLTMASKGAQDVESLIFPDFSCVPRVRKPTGVVQIRGKQEDLYNLKVDPSDTLLDLKFLLSEELKTLPEHIQLAKNWSERFLSDSASVQSLGLFDNMQSNVVCNYWLELPGDDGNPHNVIIRSAAHLPQHDPTEPNLGCFIRNCCKKYAKLPFLGVRKFNADGSRGEYEFMTFNEVNSRISNIAAGMRALKLKPGNETKIGICSQNRPEWLLTDFANQTQGFVTVPLYTSLGKNAIEYIVEHAGIQLVVCDISVIPAIVDAKQRCPNLKYIVAMDAWPTDQQWLNANQNSGITYRFSELEALGAKDPVSDQYPDENGLAIICYTSGTTGNPKGVCLNQRNEVTKFHSARNDAAQQRLQTGDSILSFMPLAHIYGRHVEWLCAQFGIQVGYWQGDKMKLMDDLRVLKPVVFPSIPRIYQKFQDAINQQVNSNSWLKRWLYHKAFDAKSKAIDAGVAPWPLWDKLVFSKIRAVFGGRIRVATSGSAPLSVATARFLRIVFADEVMEGYGLTETNATGTTSSPHDKNTYGHVGSVSTLLEMKLVDVPDMQYLTTDEPEPRGEIWLRGGSVFQGYYRNPEATKEVLREDGWFATGDIGKWRLDGKLQLIDRKKNLFKLAQGEYIRPEYIEGIYKRSLYVANIFVHGNSDETYLVAVIYPDPEVFARWATQNGLGSIANNLEALIKEPGVRSAIEKDMEKIAAEESLQGYEKVKKFILVKDDFSVENGLLTSTMKLKRHAAKKKFAEEIKRMYAEPILTKSKL